MLINSYDWAYDTFSHANLGDKRRVSRLIQLACSMANQLGKSVVKASESSAQIEAAYRFIRNPAVDTQAIAESGFRATADKLECFDTVLALEDTTSLNFSHNSVSNELGHVTSHKTSRGIQAHSVLAFAPDEGQVLGLLEQTRWTRDIKKMGQKKQATQRPYREKESYKWERASRQMSERLGEQMSRVISVCDRESDIIEYLKYKCDHQQRFVVRCMMSRHIEEADNKLFAYGNTLQSASGRQVLIPQKGGRKARVAECDIRYAPVTLKMPSNKSGTSTALYYVSCIERNAPNGLSWHLLTTEKITSAAEAEKVIQYYERRWLVEEFHKAWKSGGTQVEKLRMQCRDNLERMVVILAFIAVRVHQLRYLGNNKDVAEKTSCEAILSTIEWKLLWKKQEERALPRRPPSLYWAYQSMGKLGGWYDSKSNGRVGWETLWEGWFKLQTILEGYQLAMSLWSDM